MKTDIGNEHTSPPFRKGSYFGIYRANSPEEAEFKFRRHLAKTMSMPHQPTINRTKAAKRISTKDFEVEEYLPVEGDPNWIGRIAFQLPSKKHTI